MLPVLRAGASGSIDQQFWAQAYDRVSGFIASRNAMADAMFYASVQDGVKAYVDIGGIVLAPLGVVSAGIAFQNGDITASEFLMNVLPTGRISRAFNRAPDIQDINTRPLSNSLDIVTLNGYDGLQGTIRIGGAAESAVPFATRGGTYVLKDAEGAIVRSGRTNDYVRRAAEHARDPDLAGYQFERFHPTDVYAEQRGLEQILHETYKPQLNKINGVSPTNKNASTYRKAAQDYLLRQGEP